MKEEKPILQVFFLLNILIALVFVFISLLSIFSPRGAEPNDLPNLIIWIIMGIPIYFSIIPLAIFIFRKRMNIIFLGVITIIWVIFLISILLILFGVLTQSYLNFDLVPILKSSERSFYIAVRAAAIIIGAYILWSILFNKGKKNLEEEDDVNWFVGLLSVMCGLFFMLLGFILIFMSPFSFLTKLSGAILLWIIGLVIWFGGYSMMKK